MLLFPSGPLGLGGAADTMVWVGVPTKWQEQKITSTYTLKLCRNSMGVPFYLTEASSCRHCHCRCRCLPLATTTTTVTPWLHLHRRRRPHRHRHPHCRHHRLPPLLCDLLIVVSSCPLPFLIRWWPSRPPHLPSSSLLLWLSSSSSSLPTTPPLRMICLIVVCIPRPLSCRLPVAPPPLHFASFVDC